MKRTIYKNLLNWKNNPNRKPLIVDGARQIGKTYILQEFGNNEFDNVAYINCDKETTMKNLFYDFDTERLIRSFSAITGKKIEKEKTLIIIDEIQEVPEAITSLKYFCEDAKDYYIVAAGSLLGISIHSGTGFPVGKVDELKMYPMTFEEFLNASGNEGLINLYESKNWEEISSLQDKFIDLLRQYYFVGGMPEAVDSYFKNKDYIEVRTIQNRILNDYDKDFAKHIPSNMLTKVRIVYNSIPSQLAKENKKFLYGLLKKGARAKEYEDAIEWLINAGLLYKSTRITKLNKPIKFYEDPSAFKLFISDVGLLGAMCNVSAKDVITNPDYFIEYKGAFSEQYVALELLASDNKLFYFSKDDSTMELDFVFEKDELVVLEVKAGNNIRSKSLLSAINMNNELMPIRLSMLPYKRQEKIINVPLYCSGKYFD